MSDVKTLTTAVWCRSRLESVQIFMHRHVDFFFLIPRDIRDADSTWLSVNVEAEKRGGGVVEGLKLPSKQLPVSQLSYSFNYANLSRTLSLKFFRIDELKEKKKSPQRWVTQKCFAYQKENISSFAVNMCIITLHGCRWSLTRIWSQPRVDIWGTAVLLHSHIRFIS